MLDQLNRKCIKRSETYGEKYEYLLYFALLGLALAFPFLRAAEIVLEGGQFQWRYILHAWGEILPFVVLLPQPRLRLRQGTKPPCALWSRKAPFSPPNWGEVRQFGPAKVSFPRQVGAAEALWPRKVPFSPPSWCC